jgi:CheY-like chemotaxis protein
MPFRFLIADDYKAHQRLLGNIILRLGGEWELADDGQRALHLAQTEPFDVILMDLQMPGLGGVAAADQLIEHGTSQEQRPRIVAITGENTEEKRLLCRAIGMDGFITKPFDIGLLGEALQQVTIRGHCWEEGAARRLLNRDHLHRALSGGEDREAMARFDAWAAAAPAGLRGLMDTHCFDKIEQLRADSETFGFLGVVNALESLQWTSQASAVWLVETARTFRICLTAARESLREASEYMLAA